MHLVYAPLDFFFLLTPRKTFRGLYHKVSTLRRPLRPRSYLCVKFIFIKGIVCPAIHYNLTITSVFFKTVCFQFSTMEKIPVEDVCFQFIRDFVFLLINVFQPEQGAVVCSSLKLLTCSCSKYEEYKSFG